MFGLSVAIATPFDKNGKIELGEFGNHVFNLLNSNVNSITFFGTTGEGPSISFDEKINSLDYLLKRNLKLEHVIVSIIVSSFETAKFEVEKYNELGIRNFLIAPPFFFKEPYQIALENWFASVFSSSGNKNKFFLYNIPQITKIKITYELVKKLRKRFGTNRIVGVKDSSGDMEQTYKFLKLKDIIITVGDERLIALAMKSGGAGSICGLSNIYPEILLDIIHNKKDNPKILRIVKQILKYPVVPAIKSLISIKTKNKIWLNVRPPLNNLSDKSVENLKKIF
ncbi:MAG: dihydrodipicolinate synthase family protein [Paracoccaceae bacterium]